MKKLKPNMSRDEFVEHVEENWGTNVAELKEVGLSIEVCGCSSVVCPGWSLHKAIERVAKALTNPTCAEGEQKAEILINDLIGRFKAGEIGDVLNNDYSDKYDFCIKLPGTAPSFLGVNAVRIFYFYKEEVRILKRPVTAGEISVLLGRAEAKGAASKAQDASPTCPKCGSHDMCVSTVLDGRYVCGRCMKVVLGEAPVVKAEPVGPKALRCDVCGEWKTTVTKAIDHARSLKYRDEFVVQICPECLFTCRSMCRYDA
jgi:ribosomal protein S27AE